MTDANDVQRSRAGFSQVLDAAARLPGVRIDRAVYLRAALARYCDEAQIETAVVRSPAVAGVPNHVVRAVAQTSIAYETSKVTGLSALAGVPGGLAVLGTVPADAAQYVGHMLRIAQKLAYIYSWPDLFDDGGGDLDEATEGILTLFLGVMVGVQLAQAGVSKVSAILAQQVLAQLPRHALTKGAVYPVVKKVAAVLGVSMTKRLFAGGVAKVVPVLGAVVAGGLTLGTFLPMSRKLERHLASLEITRPDRGVVFDESVVVPDEA
ncbi:hypothetical protein [Cellulomonas iranensis]|uniref:hypothetical protein n=1 Tax=Cellulomonas iranensis TaxID=76862 RepID=UPI000B3CADC6|nr:hypothetical protein [Cellulomonas iranensis]